MFEAFLKVTTLHIACLVLIISKAGQLIDPPSVEKIGLQERLLPQIKSP